ncbi:MAG: hypothetical protein QF718_02565 [Phycisphaerales bacterium]|jgi:hypothetical protein|nr:hypothetical protein [Phycisphaerales bacterium]
MINIIVLSLFVSAQASDPATLRGGVWLPRLGGTVKDGGGEIDFETNVNLRDREVVPLIEFSLKPVTDLTTSFSFFDFSTDGSGSYVGNDTFGSMTLSNGDRWRGSTSIQSVGFEAAWDTWKPYESSDNVTLSFAPVAGFRWFGIDSQLANITTSQEVVHKNSWTSLQGGLQMAFDWDTVDSIDFVDSVSIESQLLVGALLGDDGGSMWSVEAGISVAFSNKFSGYFGYRLQELSAEDGSYTFDAGLQGLYAGFQIRF